MHPAPRVRERERVTEIQRDRERERVGEIQKDREVIKCKIEIER